jgi:hypothetical protein
VLSSLVYVAANVAGALVWEGYSSTSQTVSELFAVDAPSRPLVVAILFAYNPLVIAFGWSVWSAAGPERRPLRVAGASLMGVGVIGFAGPFVPVHLRGVEPTITDTLHVVTTIAIVICTMVAIGFGSRAFGRWFRAYSLATLVTLIVFGAWAALDGARLAANLPTPWLGVTERVNIGAYLIWVAVLAVRLLRDEAAAADRSTCARAVHRP